MLSFHHISCYYTRRLHSESTPPLLWRRINPQHLGSVARQRVASYIATKKFFATKEFGTIKFTASKPFIHYMRYQTLRTLPPHSERQSDHITQIPSCGDEVPHTTLCVGSVRFPLFSCTFHVNLYQQPGTPRFR